MLVVLTIAQFLVRRMIEPRVIGNKVGLSSLTTFIAMFIGFKMFGFSGILIGPLLVVVIVSLFNQTSIKISHLLKNKEGDFLNSVESPLCCIRRLQANKCCFTRMRRVSSKCFCGKPSANVAAGTDVRIPTNEVKSLI